MELLRSLFGWRTWELSRPNERIFAQYSGWSHTKKSGGRASPILTSLASVSLLPLSRSSRLARSLPLMRAGSGCRQCRPTSRCGSGQCEHAGPASRQVWQRAARGREHAGPEAGGATRTCRRGRRLAARPREVVGAAASTRRQRWAVRPRKQARSTASERANIGGVRRRAA